MLQGFPQGWWDRQNNQQVLSGLWTQYLVLAGILDVLDKGKV
jgi:hypothetical protein